MKFLQEMIAKKRQAQASDSAAPEAVEDGGFVLPQMSAVSGAATALPSQQPPEPAPVIPIRQPEGGSAENTPAFVQNESLDWDVSNIDLSAERAASDAAAAERASEPPAPSVAADQDTGDDTAPAEDPLAAIRDEFGEDLIDENDLVSTDTGPLRLEPQDRVEVPETEAFAEDGDDATEEEETPTAETPAFQFPGEDTSPDEAKDDATLEAAAEAEETTEPSEDQETPASEATADADSSDEYEEDADMEMPETQHKTAAEAAAALAQQFQQRKIWDLEPAQPAAAPEPQPEPAAAPAAQSLSQMPVPPMAPPAAPAQPEPAASAQPLSEMPLPPVAPPAAPAQPEPAPQPAQQAQPEPAAEEDDDADDMSDHQPRRRTGRVKTRLLGFHKSDTAIDPISAAEEAPKTEAAFPVGWVIVVGGPGRGASFTLTAGASRIGRGEDQAVRLDFGDTSISRDNHAVIAYDSEQRRFFMGHGGKANLVRLNDMPVLSTEPLEDGDQIRIGETTLKFVALCGPDFSWEGDGAGATDDGTY